MPRRPRPLHAYVGSSLPPELMHGLADQERWLRLVRAALPEALASQCRHCIRKDGRLIIQVNSSSTATLLRFQAPALLERITAMTSETFTGIQIRNLMPLTFELESRKVASCPGTAARRHILESAATRDADEISAALARLGQALDRRAARLS